VFYIKKSSLDKLFKDTNNAKKYEEFIEKNSSDFIKKLDTNESAKELFKVEKS
jgi:hypothetical protein